MQHFADLGEQGRAQFVLVVLKKAAELQEGGAIGNTLAAQLDAVTSTTSARTLWHAAMSGLCCLSTTASWQSVHAEGVKTVFGMPGGHTFPIHDGLYDFKDKIRICWDGTVRLR